MNSIEDFMYIILYLVMFAIAIVVAFFMFGLTQEKQASVLQDARERASVTSESYHADDSSSHLRESTVNIKGTSVYSNVLSIASQAKDRPAVFIGDEEVVAASLDAIAKGNPVYIKKVQASIDIKKEYFAIYTYKFVDKIDDFSLVSVRFEKQL